MGISKRERKAKHESITNTPRITSEKHPRYKNAPNHQRYQRTTRQRTSPPRERFLRLATMYNALSVQAVHDPLRLLRGRRMTYGSTRIRIFRDPHGIRAARLQHGLHIPVRIIFLVQRDLIIEFDIGRQIRHRIAGVITLRRLGELRATAGGYGRCHLMCGTAWPGLSSIQICFRRDSNWYLVFCVSGARDVRSIAERMNNGETDCGLIVRLGVDIVGWLVLEVGDNQ
ncbi:hypothetical protein N7475_010271 [Penicillium sp. IBT 31633x]|nr:hypothetical protein N7475_010271 [Penicillium sp. IBT 31633x]